VAGAAAPSGGGGAATPSGGLNLISKGDGGGASIDGGAVAGEYARGMAAPTMAEGRGRRLQPWPALLSAHSDLR
jgi:hypothetical protein